MEVAAIEEFLQHFADDGPQFPTAGPGLVLDNGGTAGVEQRWTSDGKRIGGKHLSPRGNIAQLRSCAV
jgi:hypothetical protein